MVFIYQIVFLIVNQERVVIFTQECSYADTDYLMDRPSTKTPRHYPSN